jgi:hypothetical protein
MDRLDDTLEFDWAHQDLDRAGRFVAANFGCWYVYDDGRYWQECPVALAHVRVGMSPSMIIEEEHCSVCERPTAECLHLIGESYEGVTCTRVITRAKLLEVSLVSRPQNPDARLTRLSVPQSEISLKLDGRPAGSRVACDVCIVPCRGIREIEPGGGNLQALLTSGLEPIAKTSRSAFDTPNGTEGLAAGAIDIARRY